MHHQMPTHLDRPGQRMEHASRPEHVRIALHRWRRLRTLHALPKRRTAPLFACDWTVPMSAEGRPASGSPPTCAPASHVDVGKRPVAVRRAIDTDTTRELGMLPLDFFDGSKDDLRVT